MNISDDNTIIISRPIKKSADVLTLSLSDLSSEHSHIFTAFQNGNHNRMHVGYTEMMKFLRKIPAFKEFHDSIPQNSKRFEVVFPKEILEKLKAGDLKLSKAGSDEFLAMIRDKNNRRIVKHLRIKEVSDITELKNNIAALHNIAVMQALNQITAQLEAIERKLISIHKEFNNDRIGKIQSGYSLFLNALQIIDSPKKDQFLISAVGLLTEGRAQLIESTKNRMQSIQVGFWRSVFKEMKSIDYLGSENENAKELIKEIVYIQRSSQIIMSAYGEINEPGAMIQSLAPLKDLFAFINDESRIDKLDGWDDSRKWSDTFKKVNSAFDKIPAYADIQKKQITLEINS